MIEFDHMTRTYGPKLAVADLTLAIPRGELFALLGPNAPEKQLPLRFLWAYSSRREGPSACVALIW